MFFGVRLGTRPGVEVAEIVPARETTPSLGISTYASGTVAHSPSSFMSLQRRRAFFGAALCALALVGSVAAQLPKGSTNWTPVEDNDFVKVKGTRFFTKDGPWFMFGMN